MDKITALKQLEELLEKGLITKEEFKKEKEILLRGSNSFIDKISDKSSKLGNKSGLILGFLFLYLFLGFGLIGIKAYMSIKKDLETINFMLKEELANCQKEKE